MSSGRLRLSVRGREDLAISGTPQYSYYLKNFARTEQYEYLFVDNSLETIVQGRTPTYGDTIRFRVPIRGDLLSRVFLKVVLPNSYLYSNLIRSKTDTFNLYSIIEHVELVIGGQLIERLTGEYILNYINLYYSSNDLKFFQEVTEMKIKDLRKLYSQFGQFVLLPIPFYFHDRRGQEIPLLSLTRQEVRINIKLAPKPPITDLPELQDVTVSTEYVLLGSETTKNIFRNNGLMYRVNQVQMNSAVISRSEIKKVIDLDFQNPIREMFVCIQPQTYQDINNSKFYNYFGNYRNSFVNFRNTETGWYLSEHHISGMSLRFNNNEYINEEGSGSAQMMCSVIPQRYYANADNIQQFKGYVYPFVIDPLARDPQGHINMSRILKKQLTLFMNTSQFTRNVRVYASSYNILAIRDGVSGLMFTNPSYYNPKIVLGESTELIEGTLPTDTEVLTPDQGFYYAIKVDDGHELVGFQIHTVSSPQFGSDQDLHDDQFSYLLNTNDTFMSNVTATDRDQYAPGTISQLLQTVIEIPNETDATKADLYHVTSSNNYIFTSNFGFIKNLRLAIKVHENALGPETYPGTDGFSNLSLTAKINVYSSNTFFDSTDIEGWLSNASVDSRIIRDVNEHTYESPGYYYAARALLDSNDNVTGYSKVHFARTYDFAFESTVVNVNDVFTTGTSSTVSFKVTNLSGRGTIRVTYNGITRFEISYNEGDLEVDVEFQEESERGTKLYAIEVSPDGQSTITRLVSIVAGGNAPPLYHAFQYLPPEGSTDPVYVVAIQAYSPAANVANLSSYQMVTHNVTPLSNLNTEHTGSSSPLSNLHFENVVNTTSRYFYDGRLRDINPAGATPRFALTMGENRYFYTNSKQSITFYVVALDTTTIPDNNSIIKMYSSTEEFGTPTVVDWINEAEIREFTLSEITSDSRVVYKTIRMQKRPGDTNFNRIVSQNYMTKYYIPFDTSEPVMTITYKGNLIQNGDTIVMERFTALSDFIKLPPSEDQTFINIQIDDPTAIITESNTIVADTVGIYSITFTATDPYYNSSTQTFIVEVEDTQPPALVSNVIIGAQLDLTLTVELNETSNIDLKQNGVVIQTYTDVTGFTKSIPGLPEGVLHTYTADTEDQYENTGTLSLGTYTPDITEPELFLNNYSSTRIFTGATLFLERYTAFIDIEATAFDNVDGDLSVVVEGDAPDTTERAGTQTDRRYTATDAANNSNVAIITFEISDTVHPGLEILNDISVNETTREITISGTATEECSIYFYRDSARTQLVSNTETTTGNTFSNTFIESIDGKHQYYLSLYDGINYTNTYSTKEIYLSDYIYRFPYEGFSNTSVSVPTGTNTMHVFLWGGNGGFWDSPNPAAVPHRLGGGGGFTQSSISPVTPGQTITVNVGEGFIQELGDRIVFGGGGAANNYVGLSVYAGSGGGASNVIYNNITVAVAGGGGGAPGQRGDVGYGGGGLIANSYTNSTGGSQTAGGSPLFVSTALYQGEPGQQFLGASTNVLATGVTMGGGGGGGWYGGASGSSDDYYEDVRGGGGGSSWLGRNGTNILTHPSNEWGTTTTFEDTSGRTDTVTGLTYTNSKMLRGANNSHSKPLLGTHYFWTGDFKNGYAVIMFT